TWTINAVLVQVKFYFTSPVRRLHIQVPSSWLILLGLLRIVDTNEANFRGPCGMPANREQIEQLVAAAPHFRNRWEGFLKECEGEEVPPWFVGMSELAHYVVESYAKGVTVEFPNLFS